MRAFIGLGSNVGDRLANLRRAVELLASSCELVATSSVYDTDPVGPPQDNFLNAVVAVEVELGARELLAELKRIEGEVGRQPRERWGPREVDLDLLLFGDARVHSYDLTLPHPGLAERAFVLVPLAEIAPDLELDGVTAADRLESVDRSGVRKAPGSLGPHV